MMTVVPVGVVMPSSSHPAATVTNNRPIARPIFESMARPRNSCVLVEHIPCLLPSRTSTVVPPNVSHDLSSNPHHQLLSTEGPHMRVKSRFPLVLLGLATAFVTAALAAAPPIASGQELPLQLTWVDREGKAIESVGPPGSYRGPDVAADGRVAVHQHDRPRGDTYLRAP